MKIFFVTCLLATFSVILIVSLDLLMGISISGIIWKAVNPFKVMEPAEYVIIFLFLLFFIIDTFGGYLNKKKKKQNPTN
ncbi:hypothetical protein COJ96_18810 [Bacillus sp. AFS073361]|uniref:hypothetical protein n=1 Tax=Bacillus sp. AFS073361 TaxID=2033511 RepID=UPI000BF35365|nr:hypothetical protein [Bacillus sp. AFS073361]PFP25813.1 hypothetical protein COJ96_18810 [Bacillus sp. AFS073361]